MQDLPMELGRLQARINKLAEEKSSLQLIIRLLERLNPLAGLEDMVRLMLYSIVESIGGTNIKLYYWIETELHYTDFFDDNRVVDTIDDPLAAQAARQHELVERASHTGSNLLLGEHVPDSWNWAFPLLVGSELIGVVKLENLHFGSTHLRNSLPIFFSHAALLLSNEIRSRTRQKAEMALRRTRFSIECSAEALLWTTTGYRIVDVNDAACRKLGYHREELLQLALPDIDPHYSSENWQLLHGELLSRDSIEFESENRTKDGRLFPVEVSANHVHFGDDELYCFFIRDISTRKQAETKLRLAASVFANSYEGILIADADNRIIDVNPAFTRITGYAADEALGQTPRLLKSDRHDPEFYQQMWRSLKEMDFWRGEIWNKRKNGEIYPEMLTISTVRGDAQQLQHYIGVFSDISQTKEYEADLHRIAHYDMLTGLANRRLLAERIKQAIHHTSYSGRYLAVCYLDLDGFKAVNDEHGHSVGDHLLIEIAGRLKAVTRDEDTVARLGGDEFVLLLNNLNHAREAHNVLERVLQTVNSLAFVDGEPVSVSTSIGATLYPLDDADADTLLRHADQAMYRAKEDGKNRYHLFEPSHNRPTHASSAQLARLCEALERQEFVLHYQPKIAMAHGQLAGVEALIRWKNPSHGLLLPGSFLPELMGTDMETKLGNWVIATVIRQMSAWNQQGLRLKVSVNISNHHLLQADFTHHLQRQLTASPGVLPGDLELEILETAAITDSGQTSWVLENCRALGVRFALDAFGSGHYSLSHFRSLPLDILKIDQCLIRQMLEDPEEMGIVESLVRLARAFKHTVVADGVESPEQLAVVDKLGCHLVQGYAIAHPMEAEALPAWASQWQNHSFLHLLGRD